MAIQFSVATRTAQADAIDDQFNGGTPPATIEIRTGAPPANCAAADSGTLLATLTGPNPFHGAASAGAITAGTIVSDSAGDATGSPGHWRVKQGGGSTVVAQGTAAIGSGDLNFNAGVTLGGTVSITSWVLTIANA